MHVFNDGEKVTIIKYGQKLVQFVPVRVNPDDIVVVYNDEITLEEFYEGHDTERGAEGFGHTGI